MEENRRPKKNGPSRKRYKDVSTQIPDRHIHCPECSKETCNLCGKKLFCVASPNDISVEDDLPDGICKCFFCNNADASGAESSNVPEEACFSGEENTELPSVQIGDSRHTNLHPVAEASTEESKSKSKSNASSSEDSKFLGRSFSSTGYASSPSDRSLDSPSTHQRGTLENSDNSSKNSPNVEKTPSANGQALSLHDPSLDQRSITTPISGRGSGNSSNTEKEVSSGYPLSLDEQSDKNCADHRKSTSPSSGEDSKNINIEYKEPSRRKLDENLEQINTSDLKINESSSSNQKENDSTRGAFDCQHPLKINRNASGQLPRAMPTGMVNFISENPRPVLPPPFYTPCPQYYHQSVALPYQPHRSPAMPMSGPSLPYPQRYAQPNQPYSNSAMNMPINQSDIPGRFPVFSRPQMNIYSNHRRPYNEGNGSFSAKLQLIDAEEGSRRSSKTVKRIEDWLENLPDVPIEEYPGCASGWSAAENEENEGIPPDPSGIFFDDQSSAEISEEENRKERSSRHPPRKHKK